MSWRQAARTVLLTGGHGFVGRHVLRTLWADGFRCRVLTRNPCAVPMVGEDLVVGDLGDVRAVDAAVRGVDVVVHLAGLVYAKGDWERFRIVNTEGTRTLLQCAADNGVDFVLNIGSVKGRVAEERGLRWEDDAYGVSKMLADQAVMDHAREARSRAATLRLPLVYGPGVKANMGALFKAVWHGVPLPVAGVQNVRSLAFVGNVAEAVRRILRTPDVTAEVFEVADPYPLSTPELIHEIARALGRRERLIPFSPTMFGRLARIGDCLARYFPTPITTATLESLTGSLVTDYSSLSDRTGFACRYTTRQGLEETAQWFLLQRGRS